MAQLAPYRALLPGQQQLPDDAATYVRELVVSGSVKPGDFLRLEPIAEALGSSITPVREGLRMLQNEGFVRLVPRRGFVVESISRQDIRDLFWSQAKLAGELAARAAAKVTQEQVAELRSTTAQYDEALAAHESDLMGQIGNYFHTIINRAADSKRLSLLLAGVTNQLPLRFYAEIEGSGVSTRLQHPRIIECLVQGDGEGARAVMEEHLLDNADRLIAVLEQRGLWNDVAEVS